MKTFLINYGKRIISLFLAAIFTLSLCACNGSGNNTETTADAVDTLSYSIAVIQSESDMESESVYRGFLAAFSQKGYKETDNLSISVTSCDGDKKKAKSAAETYADSDVDLIFAIGEIAAKAAAKATTEIPVIFAAVADPIEAGLLKSCEKPDKNVTGVSDFTPVHEQLTLIKTLVPDAKKVTTIYHGSDADSILVSTLAEGEAKELKLKYKAYSATTKREFEDALKDALKNTDALYLVEDEVAITFIEEIVKSANKKKIPVFSTGDGLLDSGCLATCQPSYESIGSDAGDLALIVLRELKPISEVSVEYPSDCRYIISASAADKLSIDINALEDSAKIVE